MPLSHFIEPQEDGSRYGYYLPDNYVNKKWNYFYNLMINSEINDGPLAETVPLQAGKGFADSSRGTYLPTSNCFEKNSRIRSE